MEPPHAPISRRPRHHQLAIRLHPQWPANAGHLHEFREPIILRAQYFPPTPPPLSQPARPAARPSVTMLPGSFAPIPVRAPQTAPAEVVHSVDDLDDDDLPLLIVSATGKVLAQGTIGQLIAQGSRLAPGGPVYLSNFNGILAFASLAALMIHLIRQPRDRNKGLPGPLRAHSHRARARAADPAVTDRLENDEWSVHHLIGIEPAKTHLPLLMTAARAGWRMDNAENLMVLPRTRAAQAKLAAGGVQRPVHDNGHLEWNTEVNAGLLEIEQELRASRLFLNSLEYANLARSSLERFQSMRRRDAIGRDRIVHIDGPSSTILRQG